MQKKRYVKLTVLSSVSPQMKEAVLSVVVWVIVSLSVPNWKPCRPSRLPTSAAGTVWPTAPWTSKALDFLNLHMKGDDIILGVVLEQSGKKNLHKRSGISNAAGHYSDVCFCTVAMTGFVNTAY